jgi:hypothetical protein
MTNCTVSGNTTDHDGGGILNLGGELSLSNSTVADNVAGTSGSAVSGGVAEVTATTIDGDCDGVSWTSNGYNIESPGDTCGFDHGTDLVNITEGQLDLGPLQDNGGPTMTHALGAGSVAIGHIPAVDCQVTEDQRGQPRPETGGDACDVGSFERQPEDP